MCIIEKFKRKRVNNQERATNLTLEQFKQDVNVKLNEIYDYFDKMYDHLLLNNDGKIIEKSPKLLPPGNDDLTYWSSLPCGKYTYWDSGSPANMPAKYGFVEKMASREDFGFTIYFHTQTDGLVYRKHGTTTAVTPWYIPHRSVATAVTNRAVYTLPTAWTFTSLPVHGWSNMIINHLVNDELSIANNAVRIGKNVSKVLVSAQIQAITTTTPAINTYNLTVLKNGLNYLNFAYRSTNIYSEYWSPMQTNPQLLNVSEGDLITIGLLGGNPIDVEILTATLVIEVIC